MNDISLLPDDSTELDLSALPSQIRHLSVDRIGFPEMLYSQGNMTATALQSSVYPVIVYDDNGMYRIIDGCKRFAALALKEHKNCPCMVLTSINNAHDAAFLRILFNLGRPLAFREKLHYVKWLSEHSSQSVYRQLTSSYPFNAKECHDLEQLFDLQDDILSAVEQGILDPAAASELKHLDLSPRTTILDFFRQITLSRSNQREFIDWLPEIACRNATSISAILASPQISDILSHQTLNQPQKVQKLRDYLYYERFPLFSAAKEQWTSLSRKLNPDPAHFQFIASDSFERNRLEIKITVTKPAEIYQILEKLKNISPEQWDKLIYPAN